MKDMYIYNTNTNLYNTKMSWYTLFTVVVYHKESLENDLIREIIGVVGQDIIIGDTSLTCKIRYEKGEGIDLINYMNELVLLLGDKFVMITGSFTGENGYANSQLFNYERCPFTLKYSWQSEGILKVSEVMKESITYRSVHELDTMRNYYGLIIHGGDNIRALLKIRDDMSKEEKVGDDSDDGSDGSDDEKPKEKPRTSWYDKFLCCKSNHTKKD